MSKDNIDLDTKVIKGARIKSATGKNRIITIHSKIFDLLLNRYNSAGEDGLLFRMKGHSSFDLTEKVYTQKSVEKLREKIEKINYSPLVTLYYF